jgi:hypothetical protein
MNTFMRFAILHKTIPMWEAGEPPRSDLVAAVGAFLGEMSRAGVLLAGEGLRASSQGVRLQSNSGRQSVTPGPFTGSNELPSGFTIVRVADRELATHWASQMAEALGDVEIDVRPVTESWDIGLGKKPPNVTTQRWMLMPKADAASERGEPSRRRKEAMRRLLAEMKDAGVVLTSESFAPSRTGRRYKFSDGRQSVTDGPFTESKELIAGYVLVRTTSIDVACRWVPRYGEIVGTNEVDVRLCEEVADASPG